MNANHKRRMMNRRNAEKRAEAARAALADMCLSKEIILGDLSEYSVYAEYVSWTSTETGRSFGAAAYYCEQDVVSEIKRKVRK